MKVNEVELLDVSLSDSNDQYQSHQEEENREVTIKKYNNLKLLKKEMRSFKKLDLFMKRIIDIVGSIVGIILLIPLTIIVAAANALSKSDNGPIFYLQERLGKNGKKFKMFKYRTMVVDAEDKINEIIKNDEELKKEWEDSRKLKNDPRITKIGKILRKTSLDEFPQFINVLIGNMSLVGPRAVVDDEIEKFGKQKDKVLSVKPGITGNWAVNGRSDTTYEERVALEAEYVDKFSIWFDIKILFKTFSAVLKKEGAV